MKQLAWTVPLALFAMARPLQLVAVTLVYAMGTAIALAEGVALNRSALLWGYLALIPTGASIHYVNEYADHRTDALTRRTPFSGGSGALSRTGLPPIIALWAASAAIVVGLSAALVGLLTGSLAPAGFGCWFSAHSSAGCTHCRPWRWRGTVGVNSTMQCWAA